MENRTEKCRSYQELVDLVAAFKELPSYPYKYLESLNTRYRERFLYDMKNNPYLEQLATELIIPLQKQARIEGIIDGIRFALGEDIPEAITLQQELFTSEAIQARFYWQHPKMH